VKKDKRSSEILIEIMRDEKLAGELTFTRILQLLGDRAFGLAIIFFALPSALPISVIPGISFVFGLPIFMLSLQMILMRKSLWLPKRVGMITINHKTIVKIISSSKRYLEKLEQFLKPRLSFMTSRYMEMVNGFFLLFLSCLLMLPIPFSNYLLGTLIIIFSLGLMEKDGFFIMTGYVATILYVGFVYSIIFAAIKTVFLAI
jgi:hypothetical protein